MARMTLDLLSLGWDWVILVSLGLYAWEQVKPVLNWRDARMEG